MKTLEVDRYKLETTHSQTARSEVKDPASSTNLKLVSVSHSSIELMLAVRYEVITEHRAFFPYAVDMKRGAVITVTDREESGWAWCITHDERGVWIPKTYLCQINHTAMMLVDYDSTELDVGIGDTLKGITVESGWLLCINANGLKGWIPIDKVKKIHWSNVLSNARACRR